MGDFSQAAVRRGVPTLLPQGRAGELDTIEGWRAVFHLLDAVHADAASVKSAFMAGGGASWPSLRDTRRRACCLVHLPRSTFLRARDRHVRSQLRSPERPFGLYASDPATVRANEYIYRTAALIRYASGTDDVIIVSNPPDSYAWRMLDHLITDRSDVTDCDLTACLFGSPSRGPLRLRIYGSFLLAPLARVCQRTGTSWACGNRFHAPSGFATFPSHPTYPAELVKRFTCLLAQWALTTTSRRRVTLKGQGRVRRHVDRGESPQAHRERQDDEDRAQNCKT